MAGDGRLDGVVDVPTSNPTSVAFGGPDGGDLYVTTSWFDLEPHDRAAEPLAGAIFRCRPGVTGRLSPRYRSRTPYANLILEMLRADPKLFICGDEAEEAWRIIDPVMAAWKAGYVPMQTHPAGSAPPAAAR